MTSTTTTSVAMIVTATVQISRDLVVRGGMVLLILSLDREGRIQLPQTWQERINAPFAPAATGRIPS
jgi:hypothetical protein